MNQPQFGQRAEYGPNDFCYRHKDRPSFTLCQRCGKTICGECQIQQPVGLICPDCMREMTPSGGERLRREARAGVRVALDSDTPVVTYAIMALCVVVWIGQLFVQDVTNNLWYAPIYSTFVQFEPWRMLTAIFTHSPSGFFHILFNMYALYAFGRELERMLGKVYYAALYLLSGLGGSVAVMWWAYLSPQSLTTPTVGASGALFGIIAATLVVYRRLNINATSLFAMLGINIVIGFLPGFNISWQAHLGGMIFGALTMWLLFASAGPRKKGLRIASLVSVLSLIVALTAGFYYVAALPG